MAENRGMLENRDLRRRSAKRLRLNHIFDSLFSLDNRKISDKISKLGSGYGLGNADSSLEGNQGANSGSSQRYVFVLQNNYPKKEGKLWIRKD